LNGGGKLEIFEENNAEMTVMGLKIGVMFQKRIRNDARKGGALTRRKEGVGRRGRPIAANYRRGQRRAAIHAETLTKRAALLPAAKHKGGGK